MEQITDKILWEYLDGSISKEDKRIVDAFLLTDKNVSARLEALKNFHEALFKEVRPEELDPEAAGRMKMYILDSLDLKASVGKLPSKHMKKDMVVVSIFIFLFLCLGLIIATYFAERITIVPDLNSNQYFFVFGIVALVISSFMLLDGLFKYKRVIRSLNT